MVTPNNNKALPKRTLSLISEDEKSVTSSRPTTPLAKSASRKKPEGTRERKHSKERPYLFSFNYDNDGALC